MTKDPEQENEQILLAEAIQDSCITETFLLCFAFKFPLLIKPYPASFFIADNLAHRCWQHTYYYQFIPKLENMGYFIEGTQIAFFIVMQL